MKINAYRSFVRLCSAVSVAVILSACTPVGPTYKAPQVEFPAHWRQNAPRVAPVAGRDLGEWWTLFGDPLLDHLVQRAAAANQDLKAAEARVRQARAQRVIDTATGSLSTSLSSTHSRRSDNTSSSGSSQDLFQAGFDAGWEVDVFGGVRRARQAADASIAASEDDLHDVLVSLEAEVVRNYVELRTAQMRLAAARENIALQEKTVDLARGRFKMGLGSELDLVQARTQLALTRAQVPAFQTSIRQAMHQLAILLDRTPERFVAGLANPGAVPELPRQLPVNLPSDLLRQRPDIRAAERRLAAATAGIGVATADLFPRFSLSALLGLQSSSLGELVSSGSRYWTVGPTLQLSLFDQGRIRAGIALKKAQRDEALAVYKKTVLTALGEVEDALVAFTHEQQTRATLGQAVASGKKAVTIAKGLYSTGLVDFLNVLQSEQALYQSQDKLIQSERQLDLDMVSLFKALGGGWRHAAKVEASPPPLANRETPTGIRKK